MIIWCCQCAHEVDATLTDGLHVYPHRLDLHALPFWICPTCYNYVGCHNKTANPTKPLGNIPNKEIRAKRQEIHRILDPLWKNKGVPRGKIYAKLSRELGYEYHTAEIKSLEEAENVLSLVKHMANVS